MYILTYYTKHECEIQFTEKPNELWLSQPGSSIAVSLVEAEAVQKHCAILDVTVLSGQVPTFRLVPIPLRSVRPFILETVELSQVSDIF
jgi:double-strand break repair protein MRE11